MVARVKNNTSHAKPKASTSQKKGLQPHDSQTRNKPAGDSQQNIWRFVQQRRVLVLKIAIVIGLLCGFCLSWRLWISVRSFPLSPIAGWLPAIPYPLDHILFFITLGLLAAIALVGNSARLTLIFLGLAGLLSLWDQTRWQPWFYQYFFMLSALGLYALPRSEIRHVTSAIDACRLIIIFTYLWSGIQKLNANFVTETWPDAASGLLRLFPQSARGLPPSVALMVPLTEIAIGVALITRRFRNTAVVLAVATHIFVFAMLVLSGENTVVWPWNLAMIVFVVLLFWRAEGGDAKELFRVKTPFKVVVLLLFGLLPALSFFDLWDSYLSMALYSGNTDQAVIYVTPNVIEHFPKVVLPHVWQETKPMFLDVNRWSYGELNVPLYPEPRIYKNIAREVCTYAENSPDIRLRIKQKPNPLTGARKSEYYDCDHLGG
jgi:hypothetical protein